MTGAKTIPESWVIKKCDDIADITSSKRIHKSDYQNSGIPFFRGKEITKLSKNQKFSDDVVYISEEKFHQLKEKFGAPQKGDILITSVGTIGSIYCVKKSDKFYFKDGNLMWLRKINNELNSNYLTYFMKSNYFQNLINKALGGSSQKALTIVKFKKLSVNIPPLTEQQKIADILSTVDEKIAVIDQQITATEELKKGLMQRLLTKGVGHTELKDSPLGKIPKSWRVKNLSELAKVKGRIGYRGYTKMDLVEKGNGALTLGGAQITKHNGLNLSQPTYLNWEKYEESPEIKVEVGDIILAQRGTLGRLAIIDNLPEPATINPSMVLIKNIHCNPYYLYYCLCSDYIQNYISRITTSTAVPMISQKQINDFKIGLPLVEEQKEIVETLSTVDAKLQTQKDKKQAYQQLKKGLMQQLLTGKIRVNNLIEA